MTTMTTPELERIHAEISKLIAETGKLNAENRKMSRETVLYPIVVGATLASGIAALTTLVIKMI